MTPEQYIDVLETHGRRVANRVVLAGIPANQGTRVLADFYACYAPDNTLPAAEHCDTGMSDIFDPTGWFVYYDGPRYDLWPSPPTSTEDTE